MGNSINEHWLGVKWVMRYIKGTVETKLCSKKGFDLFSRCYCDSDYVADVDGVRLISGVVSTSGRNTISSSSSLEG